MSELDTQSRLSDIRLRVLNNEHVSPDEFRLIIDDIRRDRDSARAASASARRDAKRASKPVQHFDLDSLFGPRDH